MEQSEFKQVETNNRQKLKFEGFCKKCNKVTFHRWDGGTYYVEIYRCLKCKTINTVGDDAHIIR